MSIIEQLKISADHNVFFCFCFLKQQVAFGLGSAQIIDFISKRADQYSCGQRVRDRILWTSRSGIGCARAQ